MVSKMWKIAERPEFTIEHINNNMWAIWGPCACVDKDICPTCDGTKEFIYATCLSDENGKPLEPDLIKETIGLDNFTPMRI